MVYEFIKNRKITDIEKKRLLKQYFYNSIKNITYISHYAIIEFKNNKNKHNIIKYINKNIPITILFQFLKRDILHHLGLCYPMNKRSYIYGEHYFDINWNKYIFNLFQELECKNMMLWFFFSLPYYLDETYIKFIDIHRDIYLKMIDYVIKNWKQELYFTEQEYIKLNLESCITYPIVYHNKNNSNILNQYCKMIRVICPFLNYNSPFLGLQLSEFQNNTNQIKCKICFITDSFQKDSCVLRDRIGIIGKLIKNYPNELDIYIASFHKLSHVKGQVASSLLNKIKNKYIWLGNNLESARDKISKLDFNIIFYPDIGMKLKTSLLAHSRLAPIQLTTWGHSETSGINTIDYYISSKYFHHNLDISEINPSIDSISDISSLNDIVTYITAPELSNDFKITSTNLMNENNKFTEKLILMDSLSTYYISPKALFLQDNISNFKSRKDFNLDDNKNIYCCLQTFYKFNIEFENVLSQILTKDPNGIIIISNVIPFSRSHLSRINKTFGKNIERIKWFPALNIKDYLNLVSLSDIVLDPFPFGGCNTSFEAFDFNIPVVTLPSEILSGRFTMGLYLKMGFTDCIASNKFDYVNLAVNIVTNEKLKNKIVRKIQDKKYLIFQNTDVIEEYKNLFMNFMNKFDV